MDIHPYECVHDNLGGVLILAVEQTRQPKVSDFAVIVLAHEHVAGSQIAVDKTLGFQVG